MPENEKKLNNSPMKAMTVIVSIIAMIGGMAAIITPMQAEIESLRREVEKTEARSKDRSVDLDTKLQMELKSVDGRLEVELKDLQRLLEEKIDNLRETSMLRLEGHEAAISHPMIFDEVRTLWRYHEKPIQGSP